jgi:hypothetical protein
MRFRHKKVKAIGDFLKTGSMSMKFSVKGQENGDLLIQVTV